MRLNIAIFLIALGCVPVIAMAGEHKFDNDYDCFYDSNWAHNRWRYYFCGNVNRHRCSGKTHNNSDTPRWLVHGESFTFETAPKYTYYCCHGTNSKAGKFVHANGREFITDTKYTIKNLSGQYIGYQCTQVTTTNVCGDVETVDCFEPDTCDGGGYLRNGSCVQPCGQDEVFESAMSNKCIKCETTAYQGITKDMNNQLVCTRCDQGSEFFDKKLEICVPKSNFTIVTKEVMKKCWRCPPTHMEECHKKTAANEALSTELREQCKL